MPSRAAVPSAAALDRGETRTPEGEEGTRADRASIVKFVRAEDRGPIGAGVLRLLERDTHGEWHAGATCATLDAQGRSDLGLPHGGCEVVLTRLDRPAPETIGSTDDRGTFGFPGLASGEYAVAAFLPDGRSGVSRRRQIAAGDQASDLDIPLDEASDCGRVQLVLEGVIVPGRVTLWQSGVCRAFRFLGGATVAAVAVPAGPLEARLMIGEDCVARQAVRVEPGMIETVRFRR